MFLLNLVASSGVLPEKFALFSILFCGNFIAIKSASAFG